MLYLLHSNSVRANKQSKGLSYRAKVAASSPVDLAVSAGLLTADRLGGMTEEGGRTLGLGILSAANIAKKNVRAILKNDKGLGICWSSEADAIGCIQKDLLRPCRASHTPQADPICAEVVAVASRSLSKAEKFIKETGLEGRSTAYGSYEELLKDPKVHAVYVPLPAGVRIEWIKKAAKAGKHIMSEKPIALVSPL